MGIKASKPATEASCIEVMHLSCYWHYIAVHNNSLALQEKGCNLVLIMALPILGRREPKPHSLTVRLSATAIKRLRTLSRDCGLSQASIIEYLILHEACDFPSNSSNGMTVKKIKI